MIVDFLTAQLRRRIPLGQPLILDAMIEGHVRCARSFEQLDPGVQRACIDAAEAVERLLEGTGERDRILFVRPKSAVHVQAALVAFHPIQIDHNSFDAPRLENRVVRAPDLYWRYLLGKVFETEGEVAEAWTQCLVDHLTIFLQSLKPRLILFNTDAQFLERCIALIAKTLDIPTGTIQHGVFSGKFDPSIQEGEASDYFIAWSEFAKRVLVGSGYLSPEQVLICGYPYPVTPLPKIPADAPGAKTVVFLGQPFESYGTGQAEAKLRIASLVRRTCERLGLWFLYRPHPAENRDTLAGVIDPASILPPSDPLDKVFRENAAFVSLTSSAVIEAGLFGRVAIQVYDELFQFENLEEVGACYACPRSEEEVMRLLGRFKSGQLPPKKVSDDYLPVAEDLSGRFLEIYRAILDDYSFRPALSRTLGTGRVVCLGPAHQEDIRVRTPRPIDAVAALRSRDSSFRLPAMLDVEGLWQQFALWGSQAEAEASYAGFALEYLKATRDVSEIVVQLAQPAEGAVLGWLQSLQAVLSGAGETPTKIETSGGTEICFSSDNALLSTQLIYAHMDGCVDDDGFLKADGRAPLREMLRAAIEHSIAERVLDLGGKERAQELVLRESAASYLLGLRDELLPYQKRLDQIRSSRVWKAFTKVSRLLGKKES